MIDELARWRAPDKSCLAVEHTGRRRSAVEHTRHAPSALASCADHPDEEATA